MPRASWVSISKRTRNAGQPSERVVYRARWTDPATGERREVGDLATLGLTTAHARRTWAEKLNQQIEGERRRLKELRLGVAGAATEVQAAAESYLADVRRVLGRRTHESYRTSVNAFAAWLEAQGVFALDQLRRVHLHGYRKHLRGLELADSTTAVRIKQTATCVSSWRESGLAPLLSGDDVRDALRPTPVGRKQPRWVRTATLVKVLAAAVEHDRELDTFASAVDVVVGLALGGFRFGEWGALEWRRVDLEQRTIHVAESKTKRQRLVDLDVSPSLLDLLRGLRELPHRGPFVVGGDRALDRHHGKDLKRRLVRLGAPRGWAWKDLRDTCASYLTCAPGIYGGASAFRSAQRLGHSVVIAERHYAGLVRGIPETAKALEEAMGAASEIRQAIEERLRRTKH